MTRGGGNETVFLHIKRGGRGGKGVGFFFAPKGEMVNTLGERPHGGGSNVVKGGEDPCRLEKRIQKWLPSRHFDWERKEPNQGVESNKQFAGERMGSSFLMKEKKSFPGGGDFTLAKNPGAHENPESGGGHWWGG